MNEALKPTWEADFTFAEDRPFRLTGGGELQPVTLRFALYGEMNTQRDNVILACHALSGSAQVADWWPQLFGPGLPFDLNRYCILGVNVLGSCYGTTGPLSINPRTGMSYAGNFPLVSIHDMVHAQARLIDDLEIERLHAVVGGSIGGMQSLAWAVLYPERAQRCISIGACPVNAMALALGHLQRQAIFNDPAYRDGHYPPDDPPLHGLALARALAMCSYKSATLFEERFGRRHNRNGDRPDRDLAGRYDVAGYLDYQGHLFLKRFDANSYLVISKAMDNFDLGSSVEEEASTLSRIQARMLLVGISSDWLFPPGDVQALGERIRQAGKDVEYRELNSTHGHDGFLADADQLIPLLLAFLDSIPSRLTASAAY